MKGNLPNGMRFISRCKIVATIAILLIVISFGSNWMAYGQGMIKTGSVNMTDAECSARFGVSVALGDLDGDRYDDLVVVAMNTGYRGETYVYYSNGGGFYVYTSYYQRPPLLFPSRDRLF